MGPPWAPWIPPTTPFIIIEMNDAAKLRSVMMMKMVVMMMLMMITDHDDDDANGHPHLMKTTMRIGCMCVCVVCTCVCVVCTPSVYLLYVRVCVNQFKGQAWPQWSEWSAYFFFFCGMRTLHPKLVGAGWVRVGWRFSVSASNKGPAAGKQEPPPRHNKPREPRIRRFAVTLHAGRASS